MSQEKTNNQYQAVSSVGNAWIVTDSKSHPGYVYYFNTVTGEAVWNLSDEEIEKARLRTHIMECKEGSKPTMCPEPKTNPPPKPLIKNKYNKKYRFGEQHQRNIHQQPEINIISTQSPGSFYSDMAINNISAFDLNALNTQLNAFNVITTPSIYNSHAWAVPRTPQFVLTPTIPVVNQSQASLNIGYNQLLKNKQGHSTKFNHFQNDPKRQKRLLQNRVNVRPEIQRNFKGLPVNKSDLRERILLRRRLNSNSNQTQSYSTNEDVEDENDVAEEELNSHETTTVVENDSSNIENDDTVYKLDLEPLKKYLSFSQANPNVWYIVVDMNMLLKEFNFIKLITESDDHCKLMVPENVMTELKDFIASLNDIPARRIYHSLTELIEMGVALVDENRSQDYGNTITNPILKTCFGLLEENYNVILLSVDSELLKLKKIIKLHMLNIEEIKSLLKENPSLCPSQQTSDSGFQLSERTQLSNDKNTSNIVVRPKTLSTKTKEPVIADVASDIHMPENSKVSEAVSVRCTADVAIQTETFNNRDKEIDVHSDCNHAQNTIEKPQNSKTMPSNSQSVNINTPGKRREIKLKRSISNPTPVVGLTPNNEKKSFRWRRKRNPNNLGDKQIPNNAKTPSPEKVSKVLSSPTHFDSMELDPQVEQAELPNDNITDHTSNLGDVIESSESSVICVNTRNRNFIVVEESSTSGVISNSESNIDIDYQVCGEDGNDSSNDISNYIVVYEVENEIMEESLQTKREEWISRFMQIMEEVLTVILHEKPMFLNTVLPPPWTLHEAVQCIRKYSNNSAVKVSTDKLSSILFDLSDKRGKINVNMTPSEYMTMYSSGVTLLRVIKDNISNCEDIDIAEFSLQKLLNDIKNPYCESEVDPHDNSINVEETHSVDDLAGGNSLENEPGSRKKNYNQRSIMKDTEKVSEISPLKPTRSTVEKFNKFSKWNLKSITRKITNIRETNSCNEDLTDSQYITFTKDTDKETVSDEPSNAPNIVRKFVKCREFEERLNINTEDEILDYDDEYHSQIDDSHEVANELNVTETHNTDDIVIGHDMVTSSLKTVNSSSLSNNVFKLMMRMCLQEIRNALNEVKTLCDRCYEELEKPKLDSKERNILIKRVESAESHILGLCISLQSSYTGLLGLRLLHIGRAFDRLYHAGQTCWSKILFPTSLLLHTCYLHIISLSRLLRHPRTWKSMLDRDTNAPSDNIQNALKKAGINISDIDEPLLLQYWDTIANSKKQADVFLNSIREIIADLKCPS